MADLGFATTFFLTGNAFVVRGDTWDPGVGPDKFLPWVDLTITGRIVGSDTQELRIAGQTPKQIGLFIPIRARIETGVLRVVRDPAPSTETPDLEEVEEQEDTPGVPLLAETPALELPAGAHLVYDVHFEPFKVAGGTYRFDDFTFAALTSAGTVDLADVDRIDEPPSTPTLLVVRKVPTTVELDDDGAIQFFVGDESFGEPIPLPIGEWAGLADLADGEATFSRGLVVSTTITAGNSGTGRLSYFTAHKTEAITKVRTISGNTALPTDATTAKVAVHEVAANGDLTRVAITGNEEATLWAAANTAYVSNLLAPFTKVKGRRYAIELFWAGPSTGASYAGQNVLIATEHALPPRLTGSVNRGADVAENTPAASVGGATGRIYAVLMP